MKAAMRCGIAVAIAALALVAEARTIRGRLVAPDGTALAGVRITAEDIEVSRCCDVFNFTTTAGDGSFSMDVPPATYVVWASVKTPLNPIGARVDVREADADLQLIARTGRVAFLPDQPPRASLIHITSNGDYATFRGDAGAVAARVLVMFTTLETGDFSAVEAAADGSFEARHFAPAGASVMIQTDPYGLVLQRALFEVKVNGGESALGGASGTVLRVPIAAGENQIRVAGAGVFNCCTSRQTATFSFDGTIDTLRVSAGQTLRVQGTIRSESPAWASVDSLTKHANLQLELLSDASGDTRNRNAIFSSTLLTPTGLAIERESIYGDGAGITKTLSLTKTQPNTLASPVDITLPIPQSLPPGRYRAVIDLCCETGVERVPDDRGKLIVDRNTIQRRSTVGLAVIEVGDPPDPRLHWTLLVDELAGGARGLIAAEDRGRYAVASRIVTESDTGVVPRVDDRTGEPIPYRLEPFALTVSVGDRAVTPSVPAIPFRFPSGSLRVEIRAPDGSIRRLGPYPFVQSRSRSVSTRQGKTLDQGGGHLTDAYQLSTMRPELEVVFDQDGEHVITLEGEIEDLWGNVWRGGGTYSLLVAKPLLIDPAVVPGAPFESGDSFAPGLTLIPPVAADVEMRLRFVPRSDGSRAIERQFRGRANRNGYFHAPPFTFDEPGEYRVDTMATFRDAHGALWAGVKTSGSVVAPRNPTLLAHGRRGADNQTSRQAWFARPKDFSHIHIPFGTGDVVWETNDDAALPVLTVQDPSNRIAALLRARTTLPTERFDEGVTNGEISLFSSRADRVDPHLDPSRVDLWAYSYRSVQRPLVRVREQIGEEIRSLYWRFDEWYAGQHGVGPLGDLPNDFKFQFGGAVIRGSAVGDPEYAIYGSLFVLIADDDALGSRVFPPFQGSGGGPSGGPLLRLKNREVDIFFHPTGVRPGSILQLGDMASFTGQIGPTLPAKVEIVVTAPSGATRTLSGQANEIGYFHQPATDFKVNETGIWRANVKTWFDGVLPSTSGQVQAPHPTGNVLGSRDGELFFYVLDRTSPALEVTPPSTSPFVRPADGPLAFTIVPPAGLTNAELHYTVTMPGFVLDEGKTTTLRYVYDASSLALAFPNLDLHDADGFAGTDVITLTFVLSGTDAGGTRQHFGRQIVIDGERLHMPDQDPLPPRRRSARH